MTLLDVSAPFHDWLVGLRRAFHKIPELAYKELKTSAKIAETLESLGVPCRTGVGRTGVVAWLDAERPGPVVAMRADMDALPVEEKNDVPYKSKHPGLMHACGHDAHVTMALGVARLLVESGWRDTGRGKILFIFQPAEEGGAGAVEMLQGGGLDREPIEAIFAAHLHPEHPMGVIAMADGVANASSDNISIRVIGKGGHGAHPDMCRDPIVAAANLVVQLQTIVSRSLDPLVPAVLTIGKFQAGTASNVVPDEARLSGTLRTLDSEVREIALRRIREILQGLEAAFGVSTELRVKPGYPVLINDRKIVGWIAERGKALLGERGVQFRPPSMGAEDFAYFLEKFPGAMVRLGCHDPAEGFTHGLHSPYFSFDERTLDVGVRLFADLLSAYADSGPGSGSETDRMS
jgi:amidohydrolase